MVAEAVKEEIEQPAPEAEAPASEPVEETPPAPEPEVEDDNLKAVFDELGLGGEATPEGTDATPKADEPASDPYAGLTPQEAAKKAREDYEAELKVSTSSREYQNYVAGVNRSFQETFNDLDRMADEWGWTVELRQAVKNKFATFNGHKDVLAQYVTNTERQNLVDGMKKALIDAAESAGLKGAEFTSAQDFVTKLSETSRSGHLSEAQVKAREKEITEKAVKAYRDRLIKAGVDIPGVRVLEVPNNPGTNGVRINNDHENNVAFNEGRITREQFAANQQRFRR